MNLHLGCGKRYIPGFIHVDLADFPHIDHRHEIQTLPMFEDGSADLIYSCHAFEYFDRFEALNLLREWRRVLKTGGTLRLAVPDFEALIQVYRETGDLLKIIGPLHGRMEIMSPQGPSWIYHRTVYDFKLLSSILNEAGFSDVRRYRWQDTLHREHDDCSQAYFPHMDKENGLLTSLNIEATR